MVPTMAEPGGEVGEVGAGGTGDGGGQQRHEGIDRRDVEVLEEPSRSTSASSASQETPSSSAGLTAASASTSATSETASSTCATSPCTAAPGPGFPASLQTDAIAIAVTTLAHDQPLKPCALDRLPAQE
eukprot:gene6790-4896_t